MKLSLAALIASAAADWHACGDAPAKPLNGRDVNCSGNYCVAVCPKGMNNTVWPITYRL